MASFQYVIDQVEEENNFILTNKPQEADDEMKTSYKRYKELFSTFPKEKGWIFEHMYLYQGFWYHLKHGIGLMAVQEHFEAKSTDTLLISTPKAGTIWFKAIVFAIMNRKSCNTSNHPLLTNNPHDLVPFLELQVFLQPPNLDVLENLPSSRLFASHIPYGSLSDSIRRSDCKIVYVCRNPKDVLVSMWKFMLILRDENLPPFSLQDAYDLFLKGVSEFGPFWDHVEGYKKASLEWPKRVFFTTYEAMKTDPSSNIKRLAEFLGHPFTIEEESGGVVKNILELCSFGKMRNLEVNKRGLTALGTRTNDMFFREGKVGDWKNHLTTRMIEHLDDITKDKLGDLFPSLISNTSE